ncbi:MAG: alpha/beta fold hydrolase [Pontiellaceae bacterium]|nr:alpha/beta fold hydrolase [Pontiellaceae bacterium]MBN2785413.1 alpha/beta fold hydrolase [Pontiellaceae bacterium]
MTKSFITLIVLLISSIPACAGLDGLFYQPDHRLYTTPARDGYAYEEVQFESADGTMLSGWFIPAKGPAKGTVVHFHGNAQNLSAHYSFVSWLPVNGFNLFEFDYRGFGRSEGEPDRKGVYEDSIAALQYIKSRTDIDQNRIIVFGQSIGGANALTVLGINRFDGIVGVVSDSAFSTYKGVASDHAGLLKPLAWLLIGNRLSPARHVGNIAPVPLVIIHGTHDRVAPYRHAEKLFSKANEPKELWTIKGGTHTSALGPGRSVYAPRLLQLFNRWCNESPAKQPD